MRDECPAPPSVQSTYVPSGFTDKPEMTSSGITLM